MVILRGEGTHTGRHRVTPCPRPPPPPSPRRPPPLTRLTSFFSSSNSFSFCFRRPPPFSDVVAAGEYSRPSWGGDTVGTPWGHRGDGGAEVTRGGTAVGAGVITMGMDVTASEGVTVATGIIEGASYTKDKRQV